MSPVKVAAEPVTSFGEVGYEVDVDCRLGERPQEEGRRQQPEGWAPERRAE